MTTEEDDEDDIQIKDEPISESESTHSSCPSSPRFMNTSELHYDDIAMVFNQPFNDSIFVLIVRFFAPLAAKNHTFPIETSD